LSIGGYAEHPADANDPACPAIACLQPASVDNAWSADGLLRRICVKCGTAVGRRDGECWRGGSCSRKCAWHRRTARKRCVPWVGGFLGRGHYLSLKGVSIGEQRYSVANVRASAALGLAPVVRVDPSPTLALITESRDSDVDLLQVPLKLRCKCDSHSAVVGHWAGRMRQRPHAPGASHRDRD